jgi:hypothetical protein
MTLRRHKTRRGVGFTQAPRVDVLAIQATGGVKHTRVDPLVISSLRL